MSTMKKGKLQVNVWHVNWTEWICTLWSRKFCPKAGVNLFSLTYKFLQEKHTSSNHGNNIIVSSTKGDIILDC